MKVSGKRGKVRLRVASGERGMLLELLDMIETAYDSTADDDEVAQRLFPSAHPDDPESDAAYRELTETVLRDERHDRVAACRAELSTGTEIDLSDPATSRRWLQVLNDLRLAVGTRIGITEDDDAIIRDEGDPRLIYYWLTEAQDNLVRAVMGR